MCISRQVRSLGGSGARDNSGSSQGKKGEEAPRLCEENARLCKEVTRLRLELFWMHHNMIQLVRLIRGANNVDDPSMPRCACTSCARASRAFRGGDEGHVECRFKPWFNRQVKECGLDTRVVKRASSRLPSNAEDINAHLVHVDFDNWRFFFYGRKLNQVLCAGDPELAKLHRLFLRLAPSDSASAGAKVVRCVAAEHTSRRRSSGA